MKCPACRSKLHSIQPGEWCCDNDACPENQKQRVRVEWYGNTQKEVNSLFRIKGVEESK